MLLPRHLQALLLAAAAALLCCSSPCLAGKSLYDLPAVTADGQLLSFTKYRGMVTLVINVASFCGLTKVNYEELVELQEKLQGRKFQILAFPCNQFNSQEPKSNAEVKAFAATYRAAFPVFAKTTVNPAWCEGVAEACQSDSDVCCPSNNVIYQYLTSVFPGKIEWNFAKFLISPDGIPIKRYEPTRTPLSILPDIEAALQAAETEATNKADLR